MSRCETTMRGPAGCANHPVQPEIVAQPFDSPAAGGTQVIAEGSASSVSNTGRTPEALLAGVEFLARPYRASSS